jgi:hypothetical protein
MLVQYQQGNLSTYRPQVYRVIVVIKLNTELESELEYLNGTRPRTRPRPPDQIDVIFHSGHESVEQAAVCASAIMRRGSVMYGKTRHDVLETAVQTMSELEYGYERERDQEMEMSVLFSFRKTREGRIRKQDEEGIDCLEYRYSWIR